MTLFYGYIDYREDDGQAFYVGKGSKGRKDEVRRNIKHANTVKKHGLRRVIQFEFEDESVVFTWERATVAILGTYRSRNGGVGCNFTEGGEGASGHKHSPEVIARMVASNTGQKRSPETCARISAGNLGRAISSEHRAKISAANIGKHSNPSPEARAKMSSVNKGRPLSLEHRAKISAAQVGKRLSPEQCAKISAAQTDRKLTPEWRENIGAAHRGKKRRSGTGEKISLALTGKKHRPESRAKMSVWHKGKKLSPEHRVNLGLASRKRWGKLSESDVAIIGQSDTSVSVLAQKYGVSRETIYRLRRATKRKIEGVKP